MSWQQAENVEFGNHIVITVLHTVALTTVGHYGVHKSHSQNHYCTLWDNGTKELHRENYIWNLSSAISLPFSVWWVKWVLSFKELDSILLSGLCNLTVSVISHNAMSQLRLLSYHIHLLHCRRSLARISQIRPFLWWTPYKDRSMLEYYLVATSVSMGDIHTFL